MKNKRAIFFAISLLLSVTRLLAQDWQTLSQNPAYLHRAIKQVTDVMVHDVYSPPVASRTYAYISVAGYEAARFSSPDFLTLAGQLKDLKTLPQPDAAKQYCYTLSAVNAILIVGKAMVISEDKIGEFNSALLQEFKQIGVPQEVFDSSVAFGKKIAEHILAWSGGDNYKISRGYPKYAVKNDAATWKPTPPSYMKAVEPYWNKIRPFCIDSAAQFKPKPATTFSTDKKSQFYKEAMQVRDARVHLTQEQSDIANFWDCNPFKMNISGHVMFASKKISPGGHWENITRLACEKTNASFLESAEAYVRLSVTIHDAFISCWDEKFRSKVIRPETYINQYIDANWLPLLQTPPFPEYTSGHSVLSAASAVILGKLFGDNFDYADSTEIEFKIPVRHFKSFKQAADEAAISRLYGGIHYMPSIKNGMEEGNKLGQFVNAKLHTKKAIATSAMNKGIN